MLEFPDSLFTRSKTHKKEEKLFDQEEDGGTNTGEDSPARNDL
jgi:hypothetical protein